MPTDSAASRPRPSRIVALRSFDWLRIGVVAVRETNVAISKQTVSIAERMTSAVTTSMPGRASEVLSDVSVMSQLSQICAVCADLRVSGRPDGPPRAV